MVYSNNIIVWFINLALVLLLILICIAFLTLFESKVLASIQSRKGPNKVGLLGILQPFADGLNLITNEVIVPGNASRKLFIFAPIVSFTLSLSLWCILPFNYGTEVVVLEINVLWVLALFSLNVYCVLFAGWSSNSSYAYLGALRAAAQMLAYD